jgi:hypothetical protein
MTEGVRRLEPYVNRFDCELRFLVGKVTGVHQMAGRLDTSCQVNRLGCDLGPCPGIETCTHCIIDAPPNTACSTTTGVAPSPAGVTGKRQFSLLLWYQNCINRKRTGVGVFD